MRIFSLDLEHTRNRSIHAQDTAGSVERNDSRGNIFENCFHQLAAPLQFLNRLLEAAREFVDLRAAVAELGGHGVERTHEHAKFVLRLLRNLVIEITGGHFAGAFSKSLNWDRDLLGQKQSNPHHRTEQQHSKKKEDEKHLALKRAKVLLRLVILMRLRLNFSKARQDVRTRAVRGDDEAGGLFIFEVLNARSKVVFPFGLPDFDAAWQRTQIAPRDAQL